jgi:two-component system, LytTR family, response regulator
MKINCIIVEDEPLAMERAKTYVNKIPSIELIKTFDNSEEALAFLLSNKIDLVFLDINLGSLSGIQLLETSGTTAEVILTTAHHEYAIKGFDLRVTDYLLKPYTFDRFKQAVDRAQIHLLSKKANREEQAIFIKTANRLEKLPLNEVLFIEGMRDYRKIHTISKKIMTLKTFSEFEKEIPSQIICRVHKSYMVAIDKIDALEKNKIKIQGIVIPVSDTYRKLLLELLGGRS